MTRERIKKSSFGAMPPMIEPITNTDSAATKVARRPSALSSQSVISMVAVIEARKAVDIHCAVIWPIPKVPMMSGMAMLTMVAVTVTAMDEINEVAVTSQRWDAAARGRCVSAIADINFDIQLDHHARSQQTFRLLNGDADRYPLGHFGEVAARIGRR